MFATEGVQSFLVSQPIVVLATVSADGTPNAAPIYWKLWYDAGTLLLLDNYMKATTANIRATGKASVCVWNAETSEAYQLKGGAEYWCDGPFMDAGIAHMDRQKSGSRPKGVVVIRIEQVYTQRPGEHAGDLLE